jgi:hypothetical protein
MKTNFLDYKFKALHKNLEIISEHSKSAELNI